MFVWDDYQRQFTCKALEGQVQEDRKLWDVEPLEGRYELLREKQQRCLGGLGSECRVSSYSTRWQRIESGSTP